MSETDHVDFPRAEESNYIMLPVSLLDEIGMIGEPSAQERNGE